MTKGMTKPRGLKKIFLTIVEKEKESDFAFYTKGALWTIERAAGKARKRRWRARGGRSPLLNAHFEAAVYRFRLIAGSYQDYAQEELVRREAAAASGLKVDPDGINQVRAFARQAKMYADEASAMNVLVYTANKPGQTGTRIQPGQTSTEKTEYTKPENGTKT